MLENASEQLGKNESQNQLSNITSLPSSNISTSNISLNFKNVTMGDFSTYENSTIGLKVKYTSDCKVENRKHG
jgi:hypothetical protein